MGKNGVGKSSTCNSIMGEKVFAASAFQAPQTGEPQMVSRQASGFTLRVIETPGLLDGDTVHEEHLNALGEFVSDKVIDAVLYVDRLDTYRLQTTDTQIMEALTTRFGPHVWDITTFVLTHGNVPPPSGLSYEQFVARRHDILKVRRYVAQRRSHLSMQLADSACAHNECDGTRCVTGGGAKSGPGEHSHGAAGGGGERLAVQNQRGGCQDPPRRHGVADVAHDRAGEAGVGTFRRQAGHLRGSWGRRRRVRAKETLADVAAARTAGAGGQAAGVLANSS